MGHVELASSLERAFGLSFDVDDLMAMENVKESAESFNPSSARSKVCASNDSNFAGRLLRDWERILI